MRKHDTQSLDFNDLEQGKFIKYSTQLKTIFEFLKVQTATASMASYATGIPQKNITRYKRDLEKKGLLFEVKKGICKHTGFKAWYLTTNPKTFDVKELVSEFHRENKF